MKKRQLGNSDLYVTEIGFGCMSLGASEAEAMRIIDEAIDLGINFFDTADLYDYGLNEEFVGKALKGKRDQIVLTTKVGNRWTEEKNGWSWDPSKAYIKAEVKESLRRLQTDYIDLYQLHGGTIEDPIDETVEAFEELKKEGIIRHYGISSIRPNVIREYAKRSNIVSILMEYSLLNRRPEEWFPLLNEQQISVIARGPLAKGILTNNNARKIERVKEKDYLSYSYDELYSTLASVKEITQESSLTGTAIQYCLHNETVAAVIPGASSIQQLQENIQASQQLSLTKEEYVQLQKIVKYDSYALHR
ncbi:MULTISPECIES: aldo/keto reductase [Bacillus]|jgi:aryl-alcohol dehydrogenase-like predicted oxidoreductase|uniref:Oxidoreductase n=1 Tax=Bacillus cereus TaxID=1396 RepID=A0A1S9TVE3_BACCE|nr:MULTISPECIES: aldo/keto reductase [Bacillus cereus group]KZD35104.1 putative oxidoreductase [Bacillus cereus]MBE7146331.1 aldo/keto reductase [Bacillus mycoides]OOR13994.1 oxidoreductase [Bacillus cereus]PEK96621.1 aldo/keto reductase [Bacillus mycoides]HDR7632737.1 aldo/keto reductase [Bacillus mycoides]